MLWLLYFYLLTARCRYRKEQFVI